MKKLLVVVDIQNDFVDGSLGTAEAVAIIPSVVEKIKDWDGDIVSTYDTHYSDYLQTNEGKHLPVKHCVDKSEGWHYNPFVKQAIENSIREHKNSFKAFYKNTFGCSQLAQHIHCSGYDYVEFIGLCTDICVVSNVLIAKEFCPEIDIAVDAKCCAGVTPESHNAALLTMKMCQVNILNA